MIQEQNSEQKTNSKIKKKQKDLAQYIKVQNMNVILNVLKSENLESAENVLKSYQEKLQSQKNYFQQKFKKNANLFKPNHKTEIIIDFWKTVDENYFQGKSQDFKLKEISQQNNLNQHPQFNLISNDYFSLGNNPKINFQNKINTQKSFQASKISYGLALKILQKKWKICSKCQKQIIKIIKLKSRFKIPNFDYQNKTIKYLEKEEICLDHVLLQNFEFCCFKYQQNNIKQKQTQDVILSNKLKNIQQKINTHFISINKNISISLKNKNYKSAVEINQMKKFLQIHLKEIEYKMLAESIEYIIGQKDNKIYVKFIQFPDYYPMEQSLLIYLNKIKENSLFRLHRVGFKTHFSEFSYNSYLQKYIEKIDKQKTHNLLYKDNINFLPIKSKFFTNKNLTCHHCKFSGQKSFFKQCGSINTSQKDQNNEIFKEIFFIKNNLRKQCNKVYCINCLVKSYGYDFKDKKIKYSCPFCNNSCFCLNCERRDHYIRLFALFEMYMGDVQQLRKNSILEKIEQFFNEKMIVKIKEENQRQKIERKIERKSQGLNCQDIDQFKKLLDQREKLIKEYKLAYLIVKRENLKIKLIDENNQFY